MGDWSDSEDTAAPTSAPSYSNDNGGDFNDDAKTDNFGESGGRGRGGRGRGRGGGGRGGRGRNHEDNGSRRPREFNPDANGNFDQPSRNKYDGDEATGAPKREIYIPPEPTNDEQELFAASISAGINFDKFDNIQVKVTGEGEFVPINSFQKSGLREYLLENVKKSGYTKPTPIQKYTIPIVMQKRDLMGCAQTGSGKTAAFVLPILNAIMNENSDLNPGMIQCLVVAPTRELVIQIFEEARKFALGSWVKVCLAYGGVASGYQGDKIGKGCHLLVATPGRLHDFVNKGIVSFNDLKFLVFDEADRLLDMGFRDSIEKICNHETINKSVVTLMFSATFPEEIQQLAAMYLKNYVFLTVGIVGGASTDVEQEFIEVTKFKKRDSLKDILKEYCDNADEDRILVFVETKRTADYLASYFSETQISTTSIHGDRTQQERELALREFRQGKRKVLIATAVAARGLDIKGVTHVINYDLPKDVDEYVHRIGRTGRVGNRGKATSFYDPETDAPISQSLVNILKQADQPIPGFFSDTGVYANQANEFGGSDIRGSNVPVKSATPLENDEDW